MKTNSIKGNLELYERIEHLEKQNELLEEKVSDCMKFIKILDDWFTDEDRNNKDISIDCGTYEL